MSKCGTTSQPNTLTPSLLCVCVWSS